MKLIVYIAYYVGVDIILLLNQLKYLLPSYQKTLEYLYLNTLLLYQVDVIYLNIQEPFDVLKKLIKLKYVIKYLPLPLEFIIYTKNREMKHFSIC